MTMKFIEEADEAEAGDDADTMVSIKTKRK